MQIYDKLELENVLASECPVKHIEHIAHTLMRGSRVRYNYITHLEESTQNSGHEHYVEYFTCEMTTQNEQHMQLNGVTLAFGIAGPLKIVSIKRRRYLRPSRAAFALDQEGVVDGQR